MGSGNQVIIIEIILISFPTSEDFAWHASRMSEKKNMLHIKRYSEIET